MNIVFNIIDGPSKRFQNVSSDHEWATLGIGSAVEIYHEKQKWVGNYTVVSVNETIGSSLTNLLGSSGRFSDTLNFRLQLKNLTLTCTENDHYKTWGVELKHDFTVICKWGKIGSTLQSKSFPCSSITNAMSFINKKLEEKLKKGYKSSPKP